MSGPHLGVQTAPSGQAPFGATRGSRAAGAAWLLAGLLWCSLPASGLSLWTAGQGGTPWGQLVLARDSHNIQVDAAGLLQPRRADKAQNLCRGVFDRGGWYTGLGASLLWSGTINGAFDGNPNTAAIVNGSRARITVDLGGSYPMTRIRFYPRPNFPLRFIPGFALFVNDGSLAPDLSGVDMETLANRTAQGSTLNVIDWQPLLERRENLERDVELQFAQQYVRYVQITDLEAATWEFAELEVYGAGYVRDATFVSQVVDLGGAADFGDLVWDVEADPGAQLVLRSRSGATPDPYVYYRLTGIGPGGQTRVKDANGNGTAWDEYNALRDNQGDMVLDSDNWSYWSPPYTQGSGRERMLSPGPRRYVQFQLLFAAGSTFDDGVRVRSLSLEYLRPPLADRVIGEIAPATVTPAAVTTFSYALAGSFSLGQRGFDAIEIDTPVRVDAATVRDISVGGVPVEATVETAADRLVVHLPARVNRATDLVRLRFDCPVYVPGTRFGGSVFERTSPATGQQITAGDAAADLATNGLAVGWGLAGQLIGDLQVRPAVVTPNGDGINDAATIAFGVLQLLAAAAVTVEIHDLSGNLVWSRRQYAGSGRQEAVWPAVDGDGARVPPGTYLCRVQVEASAGYDSRIGLIGVAY